MSRYFTGILSGLGLAAAMLCILPIAESVGASTGVSVNQVNRALKTDRLMVERPLIKSNQSKSPVQTVPADPKPDRSGQRELLDGCEPMVSPVAVPALAHLPGRCIG
jgi:hypothetical protein